MDPLSLLMIVGAGWLWAASTASAQGWSGIVVLMAGWPIVVWLNGLGQGASLDPGVRMTSASVLAVEGALCLKFVFAASGGASRLREAPRGSKAASR